MKGNQASDACLVSGKRQVNINDDGFDDFIAKINIGEVRVLYCGVFTYDLFACSFAGYLVWIGSVWFGSFVCMWCATKCVVFKSATNPYWAMAQANQNYWRLSAHCVWWMSAHMCADMRATSTKNTLTLTLMCITRRVATASSKRVLQRIITKMKINKTRSNMNGTTCMCVRLFLRWPMHTLKHTHVFIYLLNVWLSFSRFSHLKQKG